MQNSKRIEKGFTGVERSGEPIMGMPLVEILSNRRVLIENHRGVTSYSCCEISVCTKLGEICISGSKLEIANMTKYRIVITGKIENVALMKWR